MRIKPIQEAVLGIDRLAAPLVEVCCYVRTNLRGARPGQFEAW